LSRKSENQGFVCGNCGEIVLQLSNGSYRNHCPFCLYSLHVDNKPGDRQNMCRGLMKPISVISKTKKGLQLIHKCTKCGMISVNKIASDDIQSDDLDEVIKLLSLL
jgi:hypothetical protein